MDFTNISQNYEAGTKVLASQFVFDLFRNAIICNNGIQIFHTIETVEGITIKLAVIGYHIFLYRVEDLNAIITDDSIPKKIKDKYALYTKII